MFSHFGSKVQLYYKLPRAHRPLFAPCKVSVETNPNPYFPGRKDLPCVRTGSRSENRMCKTIFKMHRFANHVGDDFKINSFPCSIFIRLILQSFPFDIVSTATMDCNLPSDRSPPQRKVTKHNLRSISPRLGTVRNVIHYALKEALFLYFPLALLFCFSSTL